MPRNCEASQILAQNQKNNVLEMCEERNRNSVLMTRTPLEFSRDAFTLNLRLIKPFSPCRWDKPTGFTTSENPTGKWQMGAPRFSGAKKVLGAG
jgi:hypothetical protein